MPNQPKKHAPSCTNCGYSFADLTALERCPECGVSILESLAAIQHADEGQRRTSERVIWGLPLYDIVIQSGSTPESRHARGWIAVGPMATGVIAMGAIAKGGISIGAISFGGLSLGATSIGFLSLGPLAIGAITTGGLALGAFAQGPVAIGFAAQGNVAIGLLTRARIAISPPEIAGRSTADMSANFFDTLAPLVGNAQWSTNQFNLLMLLIAIPATIAAAVCIFIAKSVKQKA